MHDDDTTGSESRVSALLHDTITHLEPDVPALVRGSIERGRVKRRRQTIGTGAAAAAVVAVIAGVAAGVVPSVGGSGGDPGVAAGPIASSATTAAPTTQPTTQPKTKPKPGTKPSGLKPPPPAVANIPVKAANLPGLFKQLYPGKITPAEERTGRIIDDGKQGQYAHFRWDGFTTSVMFVAYTGTPAQRCQALRQDASQSGRPPTICQTRPDGTATVSGREVAPAVDGGGTVHSATLITNDGYEISILSYNEGRKGGPHLAPQPPFSIAKLLAAVTSKVWF